MADLTPEQLDEIERMAKAAHAHANDAEWVGELVKHDGGGWMASPRIHRYENEDGYRADEDEASAAEADQEYIYAVDPATVLSLIAEVRRLRREHEVACEALADALENSQAQRSNLCWLAGRAESVVRDYNRLVRHVTND